MNETIQFEHPALDDEVVAIGGRYAFQCERKLTVDGRDVLYFVGYGSFDTSCCGAGGCAYALVPGYILNWKHSTSACGRPVSEIETIESETARKKIRDIILEKEKVSQVNFQ